MLVSDRLCAEVGDVLKTGNSFLLTTASPDGDSIGSMLAFARGLKKSGKSAKIYSPEPLPENLRFLPGLDFIVYSVPAGHFDALVVMDTGASKLLFSGDREIWRRISNTVINIDHHPDNDRFGDINLVNPEAASTGELIYRVIVHQGWEIDKEMAACILAAVMADTGVFRYPNVTPYTYQVASELLAKGLNNGELARNLYATHDLPYVKLLGFMLEKLQSDYGGKLVWCVLTQKDFEASGALDESADKMVEQLDMLRDVKAFALIRQLKDGRIKVSLRSRSGLAVNEVAAKFGGGGHRQAAGCQLTGDVKEAEKKIVEALRPLFQ